MATSLWKYYTKEQTQDFLLSLHLTENLTHTPTAEMALLYALANHADEHYEKISIPKRNGTKRILHAPDSVLKYVQTQILRQVLREFPAMPAPIKKESLFAATLSLTRHKNWC